jgi:hypothetical protein
LKVNSRIFRLLFPVILLATIASCNKKPDTIGLDLLDHNQLLVYDTVFSVYALSSVEDSVVSDETSINLLGSQWTSTFGLTVASFYSHLRLSEVSPDFGTDPVVDSAFFTLVYYDYYGNINTPMTVKIYEVAEDFYQKDSIYYSNRNLQTYDTELANHFFFPSPGDSVEINDSTKTSAELKIPMNQDFINKIFYSGDTNLLKSNENFISAFKGIYVTVDSVNYPGGGSILYFNLLNTRSKITFYYHSYTNDTLNDSLTYTLVFNSNNARIENFYHNFSKSTDQNFLNQIILKDTAAGEQNLYLQGMSGIRTKIFFPDLDQWWGKNQYAVNEALLIIPAAAGGSYYPVSDNLILLRQNEDSTASILIDQNVGDAYFGGSLDDTSNSYQFRITFYIQELLKDSSDYGLLLYPSGKTVRANEVKLHGTHNNEPDTSRMELRLIYTKLD